MRGSFEKIIGKTISGVYTRDNENDPQGQMFLLFDDDTYFEIYGYGSMKGAGGIDKGDLDKVMSLNLPSGKGEVHK